MERAEFKTVPVGRGSEVDEPPSESWEAGSAPSPPGLGIRERKVFDFLRARNEVLAEAYRRLIELSTARQTADPLAALLAMHLCRELMNTLPGQWGVARGGYVEYHESIRRLVIAWPGDDAGGRDEMPPVAREILLALLSEHEASGNRVDRFEAFLRVANPARPLVVPNHVARSWRQIHERALKVTHSLMDVPPEYPAGADARQVVDDLTDLLYGAVVGHYTIAPDVKALIDLTAPAAADAARAVGALATPAHAHEFYTKAEVAWLPVLDGDRRFLRAPKDVVPVNGGFATPPWPEAALLVRAAPTYPEIVVKVLNRVRLSKNERVNSRIPDILAELPIAEAVAWLEHGWPGEEQVMVTNERSSASYAVRLVNEGHERVGFDILRRLITPLWRKREDTMSDHLLGEVFNTIETRIEAAHIEDVVTFLLARAKKMLQHTSRVAREHSTMWLPSFAEAPEFAIDRDPWRVLQLLYREILRLPAGPFQERATQLRAHKESVLRRLGVAVLAARPDGDLEGTREILADPATWDGLGAATRDEFRTLSNAAVHLLDGDARVDLIAYVVAATEINDRYDEAYLGRDDAPARDDVIAGWRSLYLGLAVDRLTYDEKAQLGPLEVQERPTRRQRMGFVEREPSPISTDEMAQRGPAATLTFLLEWRPPKTFAGPDETTVAEQLKSAVLLDPHRWIDGLATDERDLPAAYVYPVLQATKESMADADRRPDLATLVPWIARILADREDDGDGWRASSDRAALAVLGAALSEVPEEAVALAADIADILVPIVAMPDTPRAFGGDYEDLLSESLNSTPGEAIDTAARLLYRIGESKPRVAARIVAALDERYARERSTVISASFGRALPWIVAATQVDTTALLTRLLDENGEPSQIVFGTYVLSWRPMDAVVLRAREHYARAAKDAGAAPVAGRRSLDPGERLGQHLVLIWMRQTVDEVDRWLADFYEVASDELLSHTTRFVGDHLAVEGLPDDVASRILDFLSARAGEAGPEESKALGWASRTLVRHADVVTRVLKPAAVRHPGTDDEQGVMGLLALNMGYPCRDVAAVLRSVIDGDRWDSLPHLAPDDLRVVLAKLLASDDETCRRTARDVIDWLGGRGHSDYGSLLDANSG